MVRLGENWVRDLTDHVRKNACTVVASANRSEKSERFATGCILVQSKRQKGLRNSLASEGEVQHHITICRFN